MSHLTQMAGLTVQNFVSAAVGIAVAVALVRGLFATLDDDRQLLGRPHARNGSCARPLAVVIALLLASQGVVQSVRGPAEARTVEGAARDLPGPVASQEAIKELGTNGGGIVNANSAHPFENPTGFTSLVENWRCWDPVCARVRVRPARRGSAAGVRAVRSDVRALDRFGRPRDEFGLDGNPRIEASAPNMEGKEVRFGAANVGPLRRVDDGDVDGGGDRLARQLHPSRRRGAARNMMLGEVSPGGVGAGLYGILIFALLAVFIAGLMVGRTPEYLGRRSRRRR